MEEKEEKSLTESIQALISLLKNFQSKKYFKMMNKPKKMFAYNFLLGIVKGLGFTIGVTLIFAFIIWLLSKMTVVPIVGDWVANLLDYVRQVRVR